MTTETQAAAKKYPMSPRLWLELEALAYAVLCETGAAKEQAFTRLQDECSDFRASQDAGDLGPRMGHGLRPDCTAAPLRDAAQAWVESARVWRRS
jgi:hypothetical protein